MIPTAKPSAGLTNLEGKSKITPALCLKETISLRHSITQVTIAPAMQYATIVPAPPHRVIITPVLTNSPRPKVPDTASPGFGAQLTA
jgi:hypothetical protein